MAHIHYYLLFNSLPGLTLTLPLPQLPFKIQQPMFLGPLLPPKKRINRLCQFVCADVLTVPEVASLFPQSMCPPVSLSAATDIHKVPACI